MGGSPGGRNRARAAGSVAWNRVVAARFLAIRVRLATFDRVINGVVGLLGLVGFFAPFAAADWGLRRWGSDAVRRRPRPGARVTILFVGVYIVCGSLEFLASRLWPSWPALAVITLLLTLPAAVAVAVGVDRGILPTPGASDTDASR